MYEREVESVKIESTSTKCLHARWTRQECHSRTDRQTDRQPCGVPCVL